MKRSRPVVLILMAVVCLLLTSCEDSNKPLSDPEKAELDAKLPGVWQSRDENGAVTYYHVGRAGDKLPEGVMRVIAVTHSKDGKLRNGGGDMLVFSTRIGDDSYLNLVILSNEQAKSFAKSGWRAEAVKDYWIIKYQVQGDMLTLQFMDPEAKKRAIQAGKIKGTVYDPKRKRSAILSLSLGCDGPLEATFTDTTENLYRFVAENGKEVFSKEIAKLERVKQAD